MEIQPLHAVLPASWMRLLLEVRAGTLGENTHVMERYATKVKEIIDLVNIGRGS